MTAPGTPILRRKGRVHVSPGGVLSWLVLLIGAVVAILPFYLMVVNSLKTLADVARSPWGPPTALHLENFSNAFQQGALGLALFNSVAMTGADLLIMIVAGSMAAYTLARRADWLTQSVYYIFVAGVVIPGAVVILPLYREMTSLGLLDTRFAVVVYQTAATLPFVIVLYVGFLKAMPQEMEEAAAMDGAGAVRIYWQIVFPLVRPVTVTCAVIMGMWVWNDFLGPLVLLSSADKEPIPMVVYNYIGPHNVEWEMVFATVLIASAPLLLLFVTLQRYFIAALAGGGALKG
jgi:raffinose/stachyose/melibiose transport system permease protein